MRRRTQIPLLLNLAIFIVLEMAAFHMLANNAPLQRTWAAHAVHLFQAKVWGSTYAVRSWFSLGRTNRELADENVQLRSQLTQAREQLRGLHADKLAQTRQPGFTLLGAEVVKLSRNGQHNYLILNRGYEDGVQEKSGIISPFGVVGIVESMSAHHTYALSFQNSDISISARLGSEGGSGLLVWDGRSSRGAILKEVPLQFRYQPGDTVFTSGHSLLFPPDIPLGVAGSSRVVNGATNEISVQLFQDFSAIRFVTVTHNNSFDEIEEFTP